MPTAETTARTREIMRALKSTSTPPARAGGFGLATPPSISAGPSPLVSSYSEWTSGRSAGTGYALPRDHDTFLSGMFGPLAPIQPIPIDVPQPGEERPEPRRWQPPVGWNMPMGMPGTEGIGKLADFHTLRTIADLYSVARSCIELRKAELRGVNWDIVLTKSAAKALRGDHKGMADFAKRRAEAVRWWRRPDPDYADFSTWFDSLLEEVFVTDALALYIQPSRVKRKGLLGSDLAALDLIDGTLIRPLINVRGSKPEPPNPAYQQYSYGVPRVDLMTLLTEEDTESERIMVAEYRGDQLLYLPYSQRTWTPYGMAPIERAIIPIMAGLNKQAYQLNFFQEGSIPGLFVSPGDMNMTPAQIRELQDALNALAGDQSWKHKIIVLPGGSKVDPQKPAELADQFDEVIMTQTCMAFSVMPMELGISPTMSSSQSSGAASQMAKASQDIQERKGTVPLLLWLKTSVFDRILQGVCGMSDMEWQWEGLEEDEDVATLTTLLTEQVSAGLRSIDEARQELGLDPWNLPITSDPGWATPRTGFVSFTATGAFDTATDAITPQPEQQAPTTGTQRPAVSASPAGPQAIAPPKPPDDGKPPTPAHSAAIAHGDAMAPRKPAAKGQLRELDLLRLHLRKGHDIAEWQPRDLPGHVMAMIAEDLGKGLSVDEVCAGAREALWRFSDSTPDAVYAYLSKHYPASVLKWVAEAAWRGPVLVKLADIDMARRPGGRNDAKVRSIAAALDDGKKMDPIVLVDIPGGNQYKIADGYHRTLAYKHARKASLRAWIGQVDADHGPWDSEMHAAKLNKRADRGDGDDAGPKARNPAWDHDQAIAEEFARRLARELRAAVQPRMVAEAWIAAAADARKTKASLRSEWQFIHGTAIPAALRVILARLLRELWTQAWDLGWRSALTLLAARLRRIPSARAMVSRAALLRLLRDGAKRVASLAQTRTERLVRILEDAPRNITVDDLAALIDDELGNISAALLVTQTEVTWALSEAMLTVYLHAGVSTVRWQTADDREVCAPCLGNEAEGLIPAGEAFPSGDTEPPLHPRCRCALLPGETTSHFA